MGMIVVLVFGLIFAYFAFQNTAVITLNFLNYSIPGIPAYVVITGALLVGLIFSWFLSLMKGIGTDMTIRGKNSKIKDSGKEIDTLNKKIQLLELENSKLKEKPHADENQTNRIKTVFTKHRGNYT